MPIAVNGRQREAKLSAISLRAKREYTLVESSRSKLPDMPWHHLADG